jgi:ankyrin repeat protein
MSVSQVSINSFNIHSTLSNEEKNKQLLDAIKSRCILRVRALIDLGVDLNAKDKDGDTVLIWVLKCFEKEIAELLIDKGANPNIQNRRGDTLLIWTIRYGNKLETIELLIDKGVDLNIQNEAGQTALMVAIDGDRDKAAELLIRKGANLNIQDKNGQTALIKALKDSNSWKIARLLVESGADVNIQDEEQNTALTLAVDKNYKKRCGEMVQLLITKKADPDMPGIEGKQPLIKAVIGSYGKPYAERARQLIESGASLNVQDQNKRTPLIWAVKSGSKLEMAKFLVERGANLDVQDENGKTALIWALERGNIEAAKFLIEQGADLNLQDKNGKTALIWALKQDNWTRVCLEEIAKLIIERKADLNIQDGEGKTALMCALVAWNKEIPELLINSGANLTIQDKDGQTALMYALRTDKRIAQLIIEKGVDLDAQNKDMRTALIQATEMASSSIVELLIKKGANINIQDMNGETALMRAALKGGVATVKLLIEKGSDLNLNAKDKKGNTALIQAIKGNARWDAGDGAKETAILLINSGADLEAPDEEGNTPLILAVGNEMTEVVKLLVEKGVDLNAQKADGETALMSAVQADRIEIITLLVSQGANLNLSNKKGKTALYIAFDRYRSPKIINLLIERNAAFFVHPSLDLTVIDPLIKKLVYCQIFGTANMIALEVVRMAKKGMNEQALEYLKKAVERAESMSLERKLLRGEYGQLKKQSKEKQNLEKLLKIRELSPKEKSHLEELRKAVKSDRKKINQALQLLEGKKLAEAKKVLETPPEEKINDAIICFYLAGLMISKKTSFEEFEPVVDFFNKMDLRDLSRCRSVVLTLHNLLENGKLRGNEKRAILTKVIAQASQKKLSKQESFRVIERVGVLLKLEEIDRLKVFIDPDSHIEYLKCAINESFHSRFSLNVENLSDKFESTFLNPKEFRDSNAIFIYLASLNNLSDEKIKEDAIRLLTIYVEDVLEGRLEGRYNLKSSVHLETVFKGDSGALLLEKWKENRSFPIEELVKYQLYSKSKIDYLEIFKEKIITDNHLGTGWQEKYSHLVYGLDSVSSSQAALEEVDQEILELKEKPSEAVLLEAEKLILTLSQKQDLTVNLEIELLKRSCELFVGTEFQNDLLVLIKDLSSREEGVKDFSKYTVCDTDHPCDILLMGHEIQGSCQRLDGRPELNSGLLGPLLDGKYRVIAIKNHQGKMVARCLLKILWNKKKEVPVLFQERLYINRQGNEDYYSDLLDEMCKRKAMAMNLPLLKLFGTDSEKDYPDSICSLGGRCPVEYVDAKGGLKENIYSISHSVIIWEPPEPGA